MCRRIQVPIIVLLSVALLAADAQQPGQRRGRRGGRYGAFGFLGDNPVVRLVRRTDVQRELQLKEDQEQLLYQLLSDQSDQVRQVLQAVADSANPRRPNEDRAETLRRQVQQQVDVINGKFEQIVASILDSDQFARLGQLRLQQEGIRALDRQEFVSTLKLSDDQLGRIRQIRREITPRNSSDRSASQVPAEIIDVLSDEQQQRWEQLKGREFRFRERGDRTGRRGGSASRSESP